MLSQQLSVQPETIIWWFFSFSSNEVWQECIKRLSAVVVLVAEAQRVSSAFAVNFWQQLKWSRLGEVKPALLV